MRGRTDGLVVPRVWPRPKCRKDSPAAALRLPRRASPPHWPFHLGQAYRVRSRLAAGGRWIRTSGSRARSEPARRCPKDFGSSPSTVRTSAACNRISGPAPDCRSADTGIRRSGCRRPPRCSGYAYHLTARQAAAYEPLPARRRSGKRRRAAGREVTVERRFKAHGGGAPVPAAKPRCLRMESRSSAKMRRLSRNRRKYGHAPAAAPRCPSKPSAASQACCIAIS